MKSFALILTAATLFFGITLLAPTKALANKTSAQLPSSVLSAKTIFVENQTNDASLQTAVCVELTKWGRFQIVDSPEKADLVLRLSGGTVVRFVPGNGSAPAYDPTSVKTNLPPSDDTLPPGSTRITLVAPKTGNVLWSDQRKTSSPQAQRQILDGLRNAFAQREK
jgi:hypothetical protein